MGKKQFCFFQTAETGNRTPDFGVKCSGANHYPRAPALLALRGGPFDTRGSVWFFHPNQIIFYLLLDQKQTIFLQDMFKDPFNCETDMRGMVYSSL